LIALCIVLTLIYNLNAGFAVIVLVAYLVFTLASFGIGVTRVSNLFRCVLQAETTEIQRNQEKTAEVSRIKDNTTSLFIFGGLFICFGVPFVVTYNLRIPWANFILNKGMIVTAYCLELTLLFHVRGERLMSWKYSKPTNSPNLRAIPEQRLVSFPQIPQSQLNTSVKIKEPQSRDIYIVGRRANTVLPNAETQHA